MLKRLAIKPRFKQHIWQTFSIKIFIAFLECIKNEEKYIYDLILFINKHLQLAQT